MLFSTSGFPYPPCFVTVHTIFTMAARSSLRLGIGTFNASLKVVSSPNFPLAPRTGIRKEGFSIQFRSEVRSRIHTSTQNDVQYRRFGDRSREGERERSRRPSDFPSRFPSSNNDQRPEMPLWKQISIQQGQQYSPRRRSSIVGRRFDPFGRMGIALIVLLGGGLFYVFHLEKIPDTGRWRFLYVSLDEERRIADEAFNEILRQNQNRILPFNDPIHQYVHRIASRIIQAASIQRQEGNLIANHLSDSLHHGLQNPSLNNPTKSPKKVNWQVFVIKDDSPNAFVLPNGKIFVNTGILPICKDEDGLATVLGHEVAHQLVRHSAEKISNSNFLIILSYTVNLILGIDLNLSHSALQLLIALPNSRTCESEADHIGLRLMSSACFDPTKAPNIWKRMQEAEKGRSDSIFGNILSTHPLSKKRENEMKGWIPEADRIRQDSNCPNPATISSFKENVPALSNRSSGLFPINRAY